MWQRSKSELTDADYDAFYQHLTHDWEPSLARVHFTVEGVQLLTEGGAGGRRQHAIGERFRAGQTEVCERLLQRGAERVELLADRGDRTLSFGARRCSRLQLAGMLRGPDLCGAKGDVRLLGPRLEPFTKRFRGRAAEYGVKQLDQRVGGVLDCRKGVERGFAAR